MKNKAFIKAINDVIDRLDPMLVTQFLTSSIQNADAHFQTISQSLTDNQKIEYQRKVNQGVFLLSAVNALMANRVIEIRANNLPQAELELEKEFPGYQGSVQLGRSEAEQIAFDPNTDETKATEYLRILKKADDYITGNHQGFFEAGKERIPAKIPAERILFVEYRDGLKLWID